MEIAMTTGAPCFPQFGLLVVPSEVWSERVRTAPFGALVNPIGIDLPVTDRTCRSALKP